MIYFKVRTGIAPSLGNNDITFLDNSIYTIPTTFNVEGVPPSKTDYTTSEWVETIYKVLGDDGYTLYGQPRDRRSISQSRRLIESIPSIPLAYPNTITEFIENTQVDYFFVIEFTSLNRRLYQRNANTYVYELKGENWIKKGEGKYQYCPFVFGRSMTSIVFLNTLGDNNLSDYRNFALVSMDSVGSSSNYFYWWNPVTINYKEYIQALFSNGDVPDGTGPVPPDNPYEPGGDSGEGGGGGTFDDDSDPIPDSSLPTLSSAATGFTRIYNPTLYQLNQLAAYLWTDESIIQTIWNHAKQFFEDPMSVIIGLNIVPVPVPNGGTENFRVLYIDTGIPLTYAASQFVDVDCGTLEVKRYYGSALDQAPYTKISCFLPFIGTVQLNTDEVMGATLQVKYRVDICSGSTVAKIFVDGNCIYQYSGHCAINVPISSADFSSYVSAAISVAKLAIGAAVGGGMTALAAAGTDPIQHTNNTTTIKTTNTERNPVTGRQITMGTQTQTIESVQERPTTMASFSGLTPANVSNTVGEIMTAKPHVEHSGSFSGNTGYLGVRRPFVIIERPNMCMPASYQQFNGFPCMITLELVECSGFTKVQQIQLTGMSATNPEQAEILDLLKTGVII